MPSARVGRWMVSTALRYSGASSDVVALGDDQPLLAEERHLAIAVRLVEGDQLGQALHRRRPGPGSGSTG